MQAARWLPVAAGGLLVAAAPALWWLAAPEALPYASALAGTTLLLVGWPQRIQREAPTEAVASLAGLARDLHLEGAVLDADGRLFLPSRPGPAPPLDDGRHLYDGADGFVPGIALTSPLKGTLAAFTAADAARLRDPKALEEDLNALGAWTGWMHGVRLLAHPNGLKVRWQTDLPGAGAGTLVAWLAASALAKGANRRVRVTPANGQEATCEWVP